MELLEDSVTETEKMESQDRKRSQVDDNEISLNFITIPFVTRIYLSQPAVTTFIKLRTFIRPPQNRDLHVRSVVIFPRIVVSSARSVMS
ncbi:hypothetical protein TIFTF001_034897 [Ficus carica]|uniref:Uncharacterized protein n=1 Tax=Ficus carica TaxID=3494 RepID=A0AA88E0M1_FICCA|nr:hypothetical protein TIFTF001_034897 [Ficus carica]